MYYLFFEFSSNLETKLFSSKNKYCIEIVLQINGFLTLKLKTCFESSLKGKAKRETKFV